MEKQTKMAVFVGGPLDGQTRKVDIDKTKYRHEQPPTGDDIHAGVGCNAP